MDSQSYELARQNLEDSFFQKQDKLLLEKLKEMQKMEESKENLTQVSGIKDPELLKKLIELNIRPETLTAVVLIPLIEVAWADGDVHQKEKEAILKAAEKNGIASNSIEYQLLEEWMTKKPDEQLLNTWIHYTKDLCSRLSQDEIDRLRGDLMGHANDVAQAFGGFLGLGNKISAEESRVLKTLESAFSSN